MAEDGGGRQFGKYIAKMRAQPLDLLAKQCNFTRIYVLFMYVILRNFASKLCRTGFIEVIYQVGEIRVVTAYNGE